ncbi:MAG TPA: DUF2267 domain-containing protein [Gammaproteobacteria bacterium]|nr:DUF2267 domain-containing protein [Gammaproteobacteria bacterium]
MQLEDFMGQVQHRAQLPNLDAALGATRATLETLAERIGADEARHLGAQLPAEIRRYLRASDDQGERFSSDEFLQRICEREGIDLPVSVYHARVVIEVLQEAVSPGEMGNILERLPDDYLRLFTGGGDKMPS